MSSATALARALMAELVGMGVQDVVLSPGSRSAPIAFAASRLAAAGAIRLHVRVDERSAGYLAVGLARVSGAPVVVACTSGTAVANLAPAVVEASYSGLPLVVLTADRPPEARGVGSPQTIDQVGIFGGMVRFSADLGGPAGGDSTLDPARHAVRAAVGAALGATTVGPVAPGGSTRTGPVHLNVGFRPPLVPDPDDRGRAGAEQRAPDDGPPRVGPAVPCGVDAQEAGLAARGVLLVGDLPVAHPDLRESLGALARSRGWPIVAEPTANLHDHPNALAHGVLVLGAERFLAGHRPDVVVTAGLFGLSRPTVALLGAAGRHVALDLPGVGREVCDPARTAAVVLPGVPDVGRAPEPEPAWLSDWKRADGVAADVVAARLGGPRLTGAAVARAIVGGAPDDSLLLVAASWPVRQVEAFAAGRRGALLVGNRGANGIDGLVSTAWGAALAHQDRGGGPALALLGDLAFLHDHGGLVVGSGEPRPDLVLVVSDNDGGGIFHQLEQGRPEYAEQFEQLFGTPLGRDLVAVAHAAGVPAERVTDLPGLRAALDAATAAGGVRIVVAHVPDRAGEAAIVAEVSAEVARRLS